MEFFPQRPASHPMIYAYSDPAYPCMGRDSDVAVDTCLLGCLFHELGDAFLCQPLASMGNKQILLRQLAFKVALSGNLVLH